MTEIKITEEQLDFENIDPWIEALQEGDTGLSSRLKLQRNFDKIRRALVAIRDSGLSVNNVQVDGSAIYAGWVDGKAYYAAAVNPETGLAETSYVWHRGKLWMCLRSLTAEEPRLGCTDWKVVAGDTTFWSEITASNGAKFHNGNVDTVLTVHVWWGEEEVTDTIMDGHGFTATWLRMTGYDSEAREFRQQSEDLSWNATPTAPNAILLTRGDMGSGWMISYRSGLIRCRVTADLIAGTIAEFYL